MDDLIQHSETKPGGLPGNVKLLGLASLLNDIASEAIYPLMPQFLISVLGGNRFHLGIIEGIADSIASLRKLWGGAWSDRAGKRKGIVVCGYAMAAVARCRDQADASDGTSPLVTEAVHGRSVRLVSCCPLGAVDFVKISSL